MITIEKIYDKLNIMLEDKQYGKSFSLSKPTISVVDGNFYMTTFVYFYDNENIKYKTIDMPYICIYCDIIDGSIKGFYDSQKDNFLNLDYRAKIELDESTCSRPNLNYNEKCYSLFDDVRKGFLNNIYNGKKYLMYMEYMLTCIPKQMRVLYNRLSFDEYKYTLDTRTLLPIGINRNNILDFYQSKETIYVLLNRKTTKIIDNKIMAEPFIMSNNGNNYGVISNSYDIIKELALKYDLQYGDMPLVGVLNQNDEYDNIIQFIKYIDLTYAKNVLCLSYNTNKKIVTYASFTTQEMLAKYNTSEKDIKLITLECTIKRTYIDKKPHKWYQIDEQHTLKTNSNNVDNLIKIKLNEIIQNSKNCNAIDELKLSDVVFLNLVKDKNITLYNNLTNTINDNDYLKLVIEKLWNNEIVYFILSDATNAPYITKDKYLSIYTQKDMAYSSLDKINSALSVDVAKIYGVNIKSTIEYFINQYDYKGVVIDDFFGSVKLNRELLGLDIKLKENANVKQNLIYYHQCQLCENAEEKEKGKRDLLLSILTSTFYVPMIYEDEKKYPMPLAIKINPKEQFLFYNAYTDMNEINKMKIKYSEINNIQGIDLIYDYKELRIDISNHNTFTIDMLEFKNIAFLFNYMKGIENRLKIEKTMNIMSNPIIAKECIDVLRKKKIRKVGAVKVEGFTAENLCLKYHMNILNAYEYLANIVRDKDKYLLELKNKYNINA